MWLPVALLGLLTTARAQSGLSGQWVAFNRAGAGDSDLQCFTPSNVRVSHGSLVIETKIQAAACSSFDLAPAPRKYTSGFVAMRKFNFLYGTVEFRARFGGGFRTGAWPAVWMEDLSCQASDPDGTDDNCNQQEIDIAEILKSDFTHINQQIHVDNFTHNEGCTASVTDTSLNFHVYQLIWSPASLVFTIDGRTTCTITSHVPNGAMYVKIDVNAGKEGGPPNDESLPWTTVIDYLKVIQGATVVFNDDFTRQDRVQAAAAHIPSSKDRPISHRGPYIRWTILALAAGLVAASLLIIFQSRAKHRGSD